MKRPLYARERVRERWLVDLGAGEVSVCRAPGPHDFGEVTVKRRGDALAPEALPGVSLTVDEVLG